MELHLEEINEQTEFKLRAIGWRRYGKEQTRILLRKKRADLDDIVRAIQVWGLGKDRFAGPGQYQGGALSACP